MSQKALEKFLKDGAEAVGGVVYLNREAVGTYEKDGFVLTEAGERAFAGGTSEAAPDESVEKAATPKKPKAAKPAADDTPPADPAKTDANKDILADLEGLDK